MKVKALGPITKAPSGRWRAPIDYVGKGFTICDVDSSYDPDVTEPTRLSTPVSTKRLGQIWAYRDTVFLVKDAGWVPIEQVIIEIKHAVLTADKRYERLQREIKVFEAFERAEGSRRERIPDSVRVFVWQRDQGKCVKCGNTSRLEFDHIIPIAKGGSNTERNIQLLCETCNRSKGVSI
jgi:hypothetical protein